MDKYNAKNPNTLKKINYTTIRAAIESLM